MADNDEFMESATVDNMQGNDYETGQDTQDLTTPAPSARPQDRTNPYTRLPQDTPPGEVTGADGAGSAITDEDDYEEQEAAFLRQEAWLISKAQEIYTTSTDYLDSNITNIWERTLAHFHNEHAPSTKFRSQSFKRSHVFRPKTRTMTKASEAALTNAMFSTLDVVDIQAEDATDEVQIVSAKLNKSALAYRLDRRMPWYQTVIGAFQSTKVYGLCISFQYWNYHEDTDIVPALTPEGGFMLDDDGTPLGMEQTIVRKDELCCDLVPPENFRFDPMCDWRDTVNTSPYLIYMMPVYAGEALENMEKVDPKTGQPVWHRHALGDLLSTRRKNYDRTRQAREGRARIDPADEQQGNNYTMLWAHMNVVQVNGEDMMFWTMGTELLLTDPIPLTKAFPHLERGKRPFSVGFSTIEAFRNYPAGDVEQSAGIQEEINIVANQRLDNVKLVLNKRYYVKRGAQVDLDALMRNVSGGGVMMNDPKSDVETVDTRDVTGSSYQEQDRLGTEMDELVGSFSQQSVQQTASRKGGETKGGMEMMQSGAGAVQDYGLRIFFETWVEPTLRQLVKLIQGYETDEVILGLAGKQAELWQRYGIDEITDTLLQQDLTVRVNVGASNTDPQGRVERLMFAIEKSASLPKMAERMKSEEAADEIFGTLGYKNSTRFFRNDKEQQEFIKQNPPKEDPEIAIKKMEAENHKMDNESRHQREVMKLEMTAQLKFAELLMNKGMSHDEVMLKLGIAKMTDKTTRQGKALDNVTQLTELKEKREDRIAAAKQPDSKEQTA